jgi:carbonic anhydrase
MQIRNHSFPAIICCTLALVVANPAQEHHSEHTWDYGESLGPSHWGDLKPEFAPCRNGHRQSPIDIRNPQKADLPPIQFDYRESPLHIIDNGHTVMINYQPGSSISVGGKKYSLQQFHFHRPSEETINGKGYEMVVHLVHADQEGKLAVVAVLLEQGKDNALLHELWADLPKEKEKEETLDSVQINVAGLLPVDHGYYTFPGSLTTPPCSENVTWFVLKHPVTVSPAEIEQFSKLYRHDARPTQPLYGRVVLESN